MTHSLIELHKPLERASIHEGDGSLLQLLIAKFRLNLKKLGKTTRPCRYDLNKIPYDYTVEMTNRFTNLDPVDRVPEELKTEVRNIVQEAVTKTIPKKKKCKKAKWLSEEDLKVAEERRDVKSKGERERYTRLNAELHRTARGDRRPSMNNAKKWRKTIEWKRPEISLRKLERSREHFMQDWAQ